jgi:hypothetical protein
MPRLHSLQSTFADALGFSLSTSRLPATDLDAKPVSLAPQIFHVNLLFTEALFSSHADNSLRTKLADLYSTHTLLAG